MLLTLAMSLFPRNSMHRPEILDYSLKSALQALIASITHPMVAQHARHATAPGDFPPGAAGQMTKSQERRFIAEYLCPRESRPKNTKCQQRACCPWLSGEGPPLAGNPELTTTTTTTRKLVRLASWGKTPGLWSEGPVSQLIHLQAGLAHWNALPFTAAEGPVEWAVKMNGTKEISFRWRKMALK